MSFSLSGSTITQSGTDANLSGLSGIAGVTAIAEGHASKPYTIYSIGDRSLTINGTLDHDPAIEQLIIGDGISGASVLVDSGTYNYGITTVFSGFTQRSTELGLVITRIANSNFSQPVFDVNGSGTFNWNGGVINTGGTVYFRSGSTVTINDAVINIQNPSGGQLFRSFTTNLNVNGLKKIGGAVLLYESPSSFEGYEPIHSDLSPQSSGRQDYSLLFYGNSTPITIENFKGFGNPVDIGYIDNGGGILKNPLNGSSTTIGGWLSGTRSDTYITTTKDVAISFVDEAGSSIDPKVYAIDVDSGNRKNQSGYNDLADKVYSSTAVAGSTSFEVTTGIYNALNTQNDITDVRFTGDVASFKFAEYSRTLSSTNINLKGTDVASVDWVLFPDTLLTQSSIATVDAYTTIDDTFEAYDSMKSELYGSYAGEDAVIVSRSGAQLLLVANDLVLDATAVSVRSYSGNTITFKSVTFTGGASATTGTVTTQNGTLLNGGVFDCDIVYDSGSGTTLTNVTANQSIDFTTAGSYTLSNCTINEVTNSSGGAVTLNLSGSTVTINTGPSITLASSSAFSLSGLIAGSEVRVYEAGTATEIDGIESSTTSFSTTISVSSVDLVIFNTQYQPIRTLAIDTSVDVSLPIQQIFDRNYTNP